ncbi:MAG: dihydroneopterin aldolase [Candidatus Poseidoniaceae archaeon]|nr:dihydroneopterin aldolase [Candidatus Poseidoniaceae archaeon]
MTTRIGLESYEVLARHGAFDYEHEQDQPFVISIWATLVDDVVDDKLENTLNYADLQSAIDVEVVSASPVRLMETLCEKLIQHLSKNVLIASISIRIEKPDAPMPHPGGLALVEREWTRD